MPCQRIDAAALVSDETTINAPLLRKVLHQIETEPGTWFQGAYRCGTGMCFAGWAAQLAGGRWASGDGEGLIAEEGEDSYTCADGTKIVGAHSRGMRVLGLDDDQADELFDGTNDLDAIRQTVTELIAQVHHVTIRIVPSDELIIGEALPDGRPPLEVMENRPGQPPMFHGGERGIALDRLADHARLVAKRLGAPYIDPIDPDAMARLASAEAK